MFIVRVDGRENFVIEAINPSQQARVGNELTCVGKHLAHLLPSPFGDGVIANCARCVEEGAPVRYEAMGKYVDKQGVRRQCCWQTLLVPIANHQGVLTHLLGIVHDTHIESIPQTRPLEQVQEQVQEQEQQQVQELELELELERRVMERTNELMAANLQLTYLATHDALTETYNRRHLLELADNEFRRASRYELSLCLMMLDIDNFKTINDEQGHLAGDQALRTVAQATMAMVRDCDLVGRYGGDEFIIVLPETDIDGARAIAQRLSRTLQEAGLLCVSIGITSREHDDQTVVELINRADFLLLDAKRNGRNRIECHPPASRRNEITQEVWRYVK
ncbi:sensor domain-containing diguanylate cyclase [Halomonas sp. DQ26W]|uniref:sensor domain-containing diguanylate cyclase n=1 Tax=Halomonas sp. DQ26W TaxID=2282311 RepID=UPI0015F03F88|nr:sensor domain-containing diguanylate cyclase [Halomonas sp. DQ26W]